MTAESLAGGAEFLAKRVHFRFRITRSGLRQAELGGGYFVGRAAAPAECAGGGPAGHQACLESPDIAAQRRHHTQPGNRGRFYFPPPKTPSHLVTRHIERYCCVT